ncbi:lamin tail domain-containing protein [Nocardioides sp.]|uniref:lamin tail domain-containing protein n=1 Tax=Nocardioides sp. TaxID=35761 RepID=UPI00286E9622|nr:lamin tail domain-containing protein [Nocardioides sp.]
MSLTSAPRRARGARRAILATVLSVLATPLALGVAAPAQAVPSGGLVITEVYPGGGNSGATYNADFVELYNASAAPISLGGKSIQYRAATNGAVPTSANVYPLPNVTVPSHSFFLVAGGTGAAGAAFPRPADVTTGLAASASAGQVYLADSAVGIQPGTGATIDYSAGKVIDFVGYGTATTFETAVKAGTITSTGSYKRASLPDSDNNNTDFVISAVGAASGSGTGVGPDNCDCVATSSLKITEVYADGGLAGSTIDHDFVEVQNTSGSTLPMTGLTLQYRAPGDTGPATVIATLTGSMAANSFDLVQLAGTVGNGSPLTNPEYTNGLDLSATGGTLFVAKTNAGYDPGNGAVVADQYRSDLVGWGTSNTFESTAADAADLSLTQSIQRENGGVDNANNLADFDGYTPSPNGQPTAAFRTIPEIQGTGTATTMANANVSTVGVVTAAYVNGTGNFNGFYLQTPGYDPANDATPNASDGIFVFTGSSVTFPTPAVGKYVALASARVSEFNGMTELTVTNAANLTPETPSRPRPSSRARSCRARPARSPAPPPTASRAPRSPPSGRSTRASSSLPPRPTR